MPKEEKRGKSKYAQKIERRRKLSGGRYHTTINNGQERKLPLPLPLFEDAD